jgi:hypothetical protein
MSGLFHEIPTYAQAVSRFAQEIGWLRRSCLSCSISPTSCSCSMRLKAECSQSNNRLRYKSEAVARLNPDAVRSPHLQQCRLRIGVLKTGAVAAPDAAFSRPCGVLRAWLRFNGGPCGGAARLAGPVPVRQPCTVCRPHWRGGRQVHRLLTGAFHG